MTLYLPCRRELVQGPRVRTVDLPQEDQPRTTDRWCIWMSVACLTHEGCTTWRPAIPVPDGDDDGVV